MCSNSQRKIAEEFGYSDNIINLAMSRQIFFSASEFIDYLEEHEEELKNECEYMEIQKMTDNEKRMRDLRIETEFLLWNSRCVVCRERKRSIVTLPCSHFILCELCEKDCCYCPDENCRLPIIVKIHAFH